MNHIYRIVWNTATACYQAVSESATGQGKGQGKSTVVQGSAPCTANAWALTAAAIGAALCMLSLPSFAGPAGGQVTAGSATITQAGTATTINQASNRAAIDWTKFSVGANESVRFNQPSASALTLNRVTGTESSAIMGSLSANGQVFILNPNGVLFGAGAQVNVGGLVASTLQMSNANFMAGNYKFAGDATGSVVNHGHITVAPGGTLALMAPIVQNTGTLSAPGGSVLLAGAQGVTLTLQTNGGLVAYTLDAGTAQALVDNGGLIQAGGGHVVLTAKGIDALSKAVVNHSGVIEAQTVGSKNGVIELLGDMQTGTVNVSGKLDASAPNADGKGGDGGFIETSAANVKIADTTRVTTAAAAGQTGMWLIDPTDFTINAGGGSLPPSSGIAASTLNASLSITNATIATSAAGTGNGDIFVESAVDWSANKLTLSAHGNIYINANLNGSGTAKLALNYGQATSNGAGSDYILGSSAKVNLPAGQNFSTKQGSAGAVTSYTVITALGEAGSTTGADLQGINGNLSGNYVLGEDINASATTGWNAGKGFDSLGKTTPHYTGIFSGLGHEISNLYINRADSLVGLFGVIYGTVRNVGVVNANIIAQGSHAGILSGSMQGTVSNSYSTGTIKDVVGIGSTGGLVGSVGVPASINNSYSTASVEARHAAGGLVGYHFGIIQNSYATGKVFNNTYAAGGLVGLSNGIVNSSYSTGEVIGTARRGGLIGLAGRDRPATTTNSYWDATTSKQTTSAGGTGKTTAQMQQQSTYVGWDFVNTWEFLPGNTYPTLRAFQPAPVVVPLPVVTTPPATTVTLAVEPPAPIDVSIAGAKTPASNLVTPIRPLPGAGGTIPEIGNVICLNFGACGEIVAKAIKKTPIVFLRIANDVLTSNEFQIMGASAEYISNLNAASAGVVGLGDVNRATDKLLKIISGAEYGDLDGALKELSKATSELKNPSDFLGKSAKFAEGAGQVMQIASNLVAIANSFSHAVDGTYNTGDQNDLLLASSLGIPGVNAIVAAITAPVTLSALAIQLASGGSISQTLAANLDKVKIVSVEFNSYVNYLATSISDGSVSIENARDGFDTIKKMRYEELVSLRDQYRNIPGAITLALTGNMGDTTRVIDAIHNAESAIANVDFSTVMAVAGAKKLSQ